MIEKEHRFPQFSSGCPPPLIRRMPLTRSEMGRLPSRLTENSLRPRGQSRIYESCGAGFRNSWDSPLQVIPQIWDSRLGGAISERTWSELGVAEIRDAKHLMSAARVTDSRVTDSPPGLWRNRHGSRKHILHMVGKRLGGGNRKKAHKLSKLSPSSAFNTFFTRSGSLPSPFILAVRKELFIMTRIELTRYLLLNGSFIATISLSLPM